MNVLYYGRHGSGKRDAALKEADRILGQSHEQSTEFLLVEPDEKNFISIQRFPEIREFCRYAGDNRVCVIVGLDKCMENKFQQSLLKLLEDSGVTFLITAEAPLLDTIVSRCRVVKMSETDISAEKIEESADLTDRFIAHESAVLYKELVGDRAFRDTAVTVLGALENGDGMKLFNVLGILPESERSNFDRQYGTVKTEMLLDACMRKLMADGNSAAAEYICLNKNKVITQFTKNLWFVFWKNVYELI